MSDWTELNRVLMIRPSENFKDADGSIMKIAKQVSRQICSTYASSSSCKYAMSFGFVKWNEVFETRRKEREVEAEFAC